MTPPGSQPILVAPGPSSLLLTCTAPRSCKTRSGSTGRWGLAFCRARSGSSGPTDRIHGQNSCQAEKPHGRGQIPAPGSRSCSRWPGWGHIFGAPRLVPGFRNPPQGSPCPIQPYLLAHCKANKAQGWARARGLQQPLHKPGGFPQGRGSTETSRAVRTAGVPPSSPQGHERGRVLGWRGQPGGGNEFKGITDHPGPAAPSQPISPRAARSRPPAANRATCTRASDTPPGPGMPQTPPASAAPSAPAAEGPGALPGLFMAGGCSRSHPGDRPHPGNRRLPGGPGGLTPAPPGPAGPPGVPAARERLRTPPGGLGGLWLRPTNSGLSPTHRGVSQGITTTQPAPRSLRETLPRQLPGKSRQEGPGAKTFLNT